MFNKFKPYLLGGLAGVFNGLLGSGGGMLAIPALKAQGLNTKKAHSNSVAVIMPLSTISVALYLIKGDVTISDALPYIFWGIIGAAVGTLLLKKLTPNLLRRLFGAFMIWAGTRLIIK